MRLLLGFFFCLMLWGCSSGTTGGNNYQVTGVAISGKLLDGTLPVVGAHVYLLAVGAAGYGSASVSLLDSSSTGHSDTAGTYVLTAQDGSFTLPGYYTCTSATDLYLYASGGNSGLGENSAAGQMATLGACPALGTTVAPIVIDEATTVAAAFALAGFATDALHISSSGTPLAMIGVANAFTNASNLASTTTGLALTALASSGATVPQGTIDTLANILASCIHSSGPGSEQCLNLFADVQGGSTPPVDTATAMIDIAHSPAANVPALYALQAFADPFVPFLTSVPSEFSLGIVFTGGGLNSPTSMAVDGAGNVWVVDEENSAVTEISSAGAFLSGANGYPAGLVAPGPIAIDTEGNAWIGNYAAYAPGGGSVVELSSSGSVLSGANGYAGGGIRSPNGLALDAANHIWVANFFTSTVTELSSTGQVLSGPSGFVGGGLNEPSFLAIDASGNAWVANNSFGITEFSNSGAVLSGTTGYTAPGFYGGSALAVDSHGDIWVTDPGGNAQVSKLSPAGVVLSGSGYTGGGINNGTSYGGGYTIAIDGAGNAWIPLSQGTSVVELSNSGSVMSGTMGYGGGLEQAPLAIAIDGSGDVWVSSEQYERNTDYFRVTEMIGIATPVVTPLQAGVKNNSIGSRP